MIRFQLRELMRRPTGAFAFERAVAFQDIDAAGVVFYPRLLEYFNDAFFAFLAASGHPPDVSICQQKQGLPIRRAEADYFAPLRFGDAVEIALVRAAVEDSVVGIGYRVARKSDGRVTAVGQTLHVFADLGAFERRPLPADIAATLAELARATEG
jgi:YbgC/YbaW family acyl-CoA thioester hydrolase